MPLRQSHRFASFRRLWRILCGLPHANPFFGDETYGLFAADKSSGWGTLPGESWQYSACPFTRVCGRPVDPGGVRLARARMAGLPVRNAFYCAALGRHRRRLGSRRLGPRRRERLGGIPRRISRSISLSPEVGTDPSAAGLPVRGASSRVRLAKHPDNDRSGELVLL